MGKTKQTKSVDWYAYEREAQQNGFLVVCGVDEAGRGPLAGPVYAAAVVLPADCPEIPGLNDSKKLTAARRDVLYDQICEIAVSYGVGSADEKEIDRLNILQATFLAMRRAAEQIVPPPDLMLVDGNRDPGLPCEHTLTIVHGDALSASIAAASILAKVSRDRYMEELSKQFPQYELERHKGYPTKRHYELLREFGISPIHRRSFLKGLLNGEKSGKEH